MSRPRRSPLVSAVAAVLGVGVLAGCATASVAQPTSGPTGSREPAPTSTATDDPTPEPLPTYEVKDKLPRDFYVKTKDPVFFITVDDGNTKDHAVIDYVKANQIPVTVFLTETAVGDQWDYFREVASQGGSVENHTMNHKSLTYSSTNLDYEICRPQQLYTEHFGRTPIYLRPPYGNGGYNDDSKSRKREIDRTASACGVQRIVMWNALGENGKFQFIRGSLTRGDIVLFHFTPTLRDELETIMSMAAKKGLRPAPLTDYLLPEQTTP